MNDGLGQSDFSEMAMPVRWEKLGWDGKLGVLRPDTRMGSKVAQKNDSTSTDIEDTVIGNALGRAIRHAQRVCAREHIKADRVERINHFITSMRRELGSIECMNGMRASIRSYVTCVLCDKASWHDIGVPTTYSGEINAWLRISQSLSHTASAQSDLILGDLEELERCLMSVKQQVSEAERINREGDRIVSELCEVFQ